MICDKYPTFNWNQFFAITLCVTNNGYILTAILYHYLDMCIVIRIFKSMNAFYEDD